MKFPIHRLAVIVFTLGAALSLLLCAAVAELFPQ